MEKLKKILLAIDLIALVFGIVAFDSKSWIPKVIVIVSGLLLIPFIPCLKELGKEYEN